MLRRGCTKNSTKRLYHFFILMRNSIQHGDMIAIIRCKGRRWLATIGRDCLMMYIRRTFSVAGCLEILKHVTEIDGLDLLTQVIRILLQRMKSVLTILTVRRIL